MPELKERPVIAGRAIATGRHRGRRRAFCDDVHEANTAGFIKVAESCRSAESCERVDPRGAN